MTALAGSLGIPPLSGPGSEGERRLAWAVAVSIVLHLVLAALIWTYRAELRERFTGDALPIDLTAPPPPFEPIRRPLARESGGGSFAAPGRSETLPAPAETSPPAPLIRPLPEAEPAPSFITPPQALPQEGEGVPGGAGGRAAGGVGHHEGLGSNAGGGTGLGQELRAGEGSDWRPRWLRQPTPREIRWFYPRHEGASPVGWAWIRCTITETGRARRCEWLSQSGQGYGDAAVRASQYFRISPREVDGRTVDAELHIRLIFYAG